MKPYLFTSERLGFRNWSIEDLDILHTEVNNDNDVMEFFPYKPSLNQTKDFILRMQQHYERTGFCYFAVDLLESNELIGFIGLNEQSYLEELGTFVDIGWRLKKSTWRKGLATEGAKACLAYAFEHLELEDIYSVAPKINKNSIAVMEKIGMKYLKGFEHPKLLDDVRLKTCTIYHKNILD